MVREADRNLNAQLNYIYALPEKKVGLELYFKAPKTVLVLDRVKKNVICQVFTDILGIG